MSSRASVFIGSSSKNGLKIAEKVDQWLSEKAAGELEVRVWNDGPFGLNEGYLESLTKAIAHFDFAVLVATADDPTVINEEHVFKARDNVIFELGLFMGKLGRARTFLLCSDERTLRLPSDLSGVSVVHFSQEAVDNEPDALKVPCQKLLAAIRARTDRDGGYFVLFPSLRQEPFYLDLLAGIAGPSSGMRDVTFLVPRESYSGPQFLERLDELAARQRGFKGGIIAPTLSDVEPDEIRKRIDRFNVPVVLVDINPYAGRALPAKAHYIGADNYAGGALAAVYMREKLSEEPSPRVLVLANADQPRRLEGFLEGHGNALRTHVAYCGFSAAAGRQATTHALLHLAEGDPFHGVFAVNDEVALGAVQAITDRAGREGSKIVVVGFDGSPAARAMIDLRLTPLRNTVIQDAYSLGERAMGLLKDVAEGRGQPAKREWVLPVRLYIDAKGPLAPPARP